LSVGSDARELTTVVKAGTGEGTRECLHSDTGPGSQFGVGHWSIATKVLTGLRALPAKAHDQAPIRGGRLSVRAGFLCLLGRRPALCSEEGSGAYQSGGVGGKKWALCDTP
jgi:hypothetical protein